MSATRFYTGAIKGLSRAPYRQQVLIHLLDMDGGGDRPLSEKEEAKVARVARFLHAQDCAREIAQARSAK